MCVEEVYQGTLLNLANAFEVEYLFEIDIGAVSQVDKVGLNQSLWRRWPNLKSFEE
jgi:hypothetical protein